MLSTDASLSISRADSSHVVGIYNLIQPYVEKEIILQRSYKQILENIDHTWVYKDNNNVIATISLVQFDTTLWEVRALAVDINHHGKKIGSLLIKKVISYLTELQVENITLFALTYTPDFFIKNGFIISKKENFPKKIYEVCQFCPKVHNCHEVAVELKL